jgi:hypothetical protein
MHVRNILMRFIFVLLGSVATSVRCSSGSSYERAGSLPKERQSLHAQSDGAATDPTVFLGRPWPASSGSFSMPQVGQDLLAAAANARRILSTIPRRRLSKRPVTTAVRLEKRSEDSSSAEPGSAAPAKAPDVVERRKAYNRVIEHYATWRGAAPHLSQRELATLRLIFDGRNRFNIATKRLRALRAAGAGVADTNNAPTTAPQSAVHAESNESGRLTTTGDDSRSRAPLTPAQQAEEAALLKEIADTKHYQRESRRFGQALAKRVGAVPLTFRDFDPPAPLPQGVADDLEALVVEYTQRYGAEELDALGARIARGKRPKKMTLQHRVSRQKQLSQLHGRDAWPVRLERLLDEAKQTKAAGRGNGASGASWISLFGNSAAVGDANLNRVIYFHLHNHLPIHHPPLSAREINAGRFHALRMSANRTCD